MNVGKIKNVVLLAWQLLRDVTANLILKYKTEEKTMSANENNLGICSTCNHVATCVRRAAHNKPVWECNEFDNYVPVINKVSDLSVIESDSAVESDEESNYLGLCKNCSARKTCVHPKLPGGVWHCEDYE